MSAIFNLNNYKPLRIDLTSYSRLLATPLKVRSAGFIPHNAYNRRTAIHRSLDLGFILSGAGMCGPAGKVRPIKPPCLVITRPGILTTAYPKPEWMEFYITYNAKEIGQLKRIGLLNDNRNEWPLAPLNMIARWIVLILEEMKNIHIVGSADRIDRLAELLIMEVTLRRPRMAVNAQNPQAAAVEKIRQYIDAHYADEPIALSARARAGGLSLQSFRSIWRERYAVPPAHYIMYRRMEEACRLLTETDLRIKEIAARLRFDDQLYFCKRFTCFTGYAPSQYRHSTRMPSRAKR